MLTEADIFELLDIHAVDGGDAAFAALDRKLDTTKSTPRAEVASRPAIRDKLAA